MIYHISLFYISPFPLGFLVTAFGGDGVCALLQSGDGCGGMAASLAAGCLAAIFPGFSAAGYLATGVFPS